jgi:hypothetical protein
VNTSGNIKLMKMTTKEKLEQIADEYAIEFAQWLFEDMEITKIERLLKLFKQSKGL